VAEKLARAQDAARVIENPHDLLGRVHDEPAYRATISSQPCSQWPPDARAAAPHLIVAAYAVGSDP